MLSRLVTSLFFGSVVLAGLTVAAPAMAESKIAVIDMQRAISETNEGNAATTNLKTLFEKRQTELDGKQNGLLKEKTALEGKCRTIPKEQCEKGMEELQRKLFELQNTMMEYQREIQKKQAEATDPLVQKMREIIRRIAQAEGYDIVIDRGAAHFQRADLDITDKAIKLFNAESKVPPPKAVPAAPAAKPAQPAPQPQQPPAKKGGS
ncbi:MAG: OmpH family outer membrane protein [Polyangiaceae bacterium]